MTNSQCYRITHSKRPIHSTSKPVDFNMSIKNFTDMVSDSILQLIFKKLSLIEFGFNSKEECSQLSEKYIKIPLSFPTYISL